MEPRRSLNLPGAPVGGCAERTGQRATPKSSCRSAPAAPTLSSGASHPCTVREPARSLCTSNRRLAPHCYRSPTSRYRGRRSWARRLTVGWRNPVSCRLEAWLAEPRRGRSSGRVPLRSPPVVAAGPYRSARAGRHVGAHRTMAPPRGRRCVSFCALWVACGSARAVARGETVAAPRGRRGAGLEATDSADGGARAVARAPERPLVRH